MNKKPVYTTGQAATLLHCSQQTVIRQCLQGNMDHYVVPGSNHRRIPHASLVAFVNKNNMEPLAFDDDDMLDKLDVRRTDSQIVAGRLGAALRDVLDLPADRTHPFVAEMIADEKRNMENLLAGVHEMLRRFTNLETGQPVQSSGKSRDEDSEEGSVQ